MHGPWHQGSLGSRGDAIVLETEVSAHLVLIGNRLAISFQRARQLSHTDRAHVPPSSLGALSIHRAKDYRHRVPRTWDVEIAIFVGAWPGEALWIGFSGAPWKPTVVKVAVGAINAVTGAPWQEKLHADPQDYIVCPPQLALDGVYAGQHLVRQFFIEESQTASSPETASLCLIAYDPKINRFPEQSSQPTPRLPTIQHSPAVVSAEHGVTLRAEAPLAQEILPDPHGIDTWDQTQSANLPVYIVGNRQYQEITGTELLRTAGHNQEYIPRRLP